MEISLGEEEIKIELPFPDFLYYFEEGYLSLVQDGNWF